TRAEYGNDDGQSHGGFRGSNHHDKEDKHLAAQSQLEAALVPVIGEGNKGQVHGVEHQLDRHKNSDDIALEQKAEHAQTEKDGAENQIPGKRNHLVGPPSQDHRSHNGNKNQDGCDFKGQQEVAEQQPGNVVRSAKIGRADAHAAELLAVADHDPAHQAAERDHARNTQQECDLAAGRVFFRAGIQKHDDKDEQHHNGAGIDDHLNRSYKFSAQQQVDQRQGGHHDHQRKSAIDGVALHKQVDCAGHADQSKNDEQYLVKHRLSPPGHDEAGYYDVGDGQRQQELPPKCHELVITEARQRAANPDIEKHEEENLHRKPEHRHQRLNNGWSALRNRTMPASEEEQRGHAGHSDHVHVFRHKEHREFHGAVFGVISRHEFGLGFRQVKWDSIRLSVRGHQVDEKRKKLGEDVPVRQPAPPGRLSLSVDDLSQTEAAGKKQHADQRKSERKFIADHLGAGSQRAKQRIFAVR